MTTLALWLGITWEERQERIKEARARIDKAEAKRQAKRDAKKADAKSRRTTRGQEERQAAMSWPKWILLAFYVLSSLSTVASIGKPRKPLTAEMATACLAITGLWCVLVVIALAGSRPVTEAELQAAIANVVAFDVLAADDPRHGTYNAYCNLKCRCDQCRKANADYVRRMRQRVGRAPSHRATQVAQTRAVTWLRETHPEAWQKILDEAYEIVGVERRPVGAPRRTLR